MVFLDKPVNLAKPRYHTEPVSLRKPTIDYRKKA